MRTKIPSSLSRPALTPLMVAMLSSLSGSCIAGADPKPGGPEMPLLYDGPGLVDAKAPDGGLAFSPGVQNIQIHRANRKPSALFRTDQGDQPGYTYHHHHDLGCWKGRLYAAWAMTPKDEDVPPFRVVFSSSGDGFTWTEPKDLFPPNQGWATRFYFYRASNNRMLVFATGAYRTDDLNEKGKSTLLVRELIAEDQLGEVYTLIKPGPESPPVFEQCRDAGFVAACREACNCRPLLEQQDYGVFLGDRRMKWHDSKNWPEGKVPGRDNYWTFGKAFCFFHRADGTLVGLCKLGFVTQSADEGESWSLPVVARGLKVGGAKEWAQRTPDGRYAMIYPPQSGPRYPMVVTTSDDGITFRDMRVVHGDVPPERYQGRYKDMGPQYLRGIAEWAGDARTLDKSAIWVIYSINKEDIWVSRIPVPIVAETRKLVDDTFENARPGLRVPGWNTYSPKWGGVRIAKERTGSNQCLELEDREPVDYVRAIRTFPASAAGEVSFRFAAAQSDRGRLEVDLLGDKGARPVRLVFNAQGRMEAANGERMVDLVDYHAGKWSRFTVKIEGGKFTLLCDRKVLLQDAPFAEPSAMVYALSFRTGEFRGAVSEMARQDLPDTEDPLPSCVYRVDDVVTKNLQLWRKCDANP